MSGQGCILLIPPFTARVRLLLTVVVVGRPSLGSVSRSCVFAERSMGS